MIASPNLRTCNTSPHEKFVNGIGMRSWISAGNITTGSSKRDFGRVRRDRVGDRSLCVFGAILDDNEERTTAGERDRVNVERPCGTAVLVESPDELRCELGCLIGNGFFSTAFFVREKVRPRKAAGNSSSVSSSELLLDAELKTRG